MWEELRYLKGEGRVGMWCLLGKARYGLSLINQLGPGGISTRGKKPHQGRKEREQGQVPGRKISGGPHRKSTTKRTWSGCVSGHVVTGVLTYIQ